MYIQEPAVAPLQILASFTEMEYQDLKNNSVPSINCFSRDKYLYKNSTHKHTWYLTFIEV